MDIFKPFKAVARWVIREELRLKDETISGLCGQLEHVRTKLNRTANHRDQLAQHLHDIGAAKTWATQQQNDREKAAKGYNIQMFCPDCKIGVGDQNSIDDRDVEYCPQCNGTKFVPSWEFEL